MPEPSGQECPIALWRKQRKRDLKQVQLVNLSPRLAPEIMANFITFETVVGGSRTLKRVRGKRSLQIIGDGLQSGHSTVQYFYSAVQPAELGTKSNRVRVDFSSQRPKDSDPQSPAYNLFKKVHADPHAGDEGVGVNDRIIGPAVLQRPQPCRQPYALVEAHQQSLVFCQIQVVESAACS